MLAQNAAVLPLPLDPVTTTETRDSLSRSTATASSSSAIRARQTPSPYFGRSNTNQSHGGKRMMPDFQDQVASAGLLEQPDRRVGSHFNDPHGVRVSADIGTNVHRGDAKSKRTRGLPRQCERGLGSRRLENHRSPRAQIHPSGNAPTLALGQHEVQRSVTAR